MIAIIRRIDAATRSGWQGILSCLLALALLSACQPTEDAAHAPRAAKAHLVSVAIVGEEAVSETVIRTGTLRARRVVRLHSQENGQIMSAPYFAGDEVREGELVVQLDDRLLKAELRKAEANREQAEANLARIKRLSGKKLISEDERLRAETAVQVARAEESLLNTRLDYTRIRAPFDGVVTERMVEPGDAVPSYAHLLTVEDPASLFTEVTVSELVLPGLQKDDVVSVRIDALGERYFPGRVERIHPNVDPRSRLGVVEVALHPVPAGAQAGQLCRVVIEGQPQARRVIPLTALRRDTRGPYVFRVDESSTARRTSVETGLFFDQQIEVIAGLNDGDRIVTTGFLGLDDGMTVEVMETVGGTADLAQGS